MLEFGSGSPEGKPAANASNRSHTSQRISEIQSNKSRREKSTQYVTIDSISPKDAEKRSPHPSSHRVFKGLH